jgi:hypothetical protein
MHTYLESTGFSHIKSNREMNQILREVVLHYDDKRIFHTEDGRLYGEFTKDFATDMGICVCGELDNEGGFDLEYTFPYFAGVTVSMFQNVDFEKHAGEESYAGAMEDPRIGATIIFYLNNMGQMRDALGVRNSTVEPMPIRLSALAKEGTILLPVQKTAKDEEIHQKKQENLFKLMKEAKKGDEDAIEILTTEEMENYNIMTQRLEHEDLLSIVDSCFMPYGIECDQYSIVGNISSCEKVKNLYTNEWVWQMQVESCDVYYDLCINANRLEGIPAVGRRIRALIWLQGSVVFGN